MSYVGNPRKGFNVMEYNRQKQKRFEIVWPEHRYVSADQIRTWYADACANGDTNITSLRDVEEMARMLSHIGHITLGKGRG